MKNSDGRAATMSDVLLMVFLVLVFFVAAVTAVTHTVLLGAVYLIVTVVLILIGYFFGTIPGLAADLLFLLGQTLFIIYLAEMQRTFNVWVMLFWLVAPVLLLLSFNGMTQQLRILQTDNARMRADMVERGALDEQTNLRTMVSYIQDVGVFTETNRRFNLPVTTVVIQVRYFTDLQRMMSTERVDELIKVASAAINDATRDNDIVYMLDDTNPTWAVLLYSDSAGAGIAATRIKERFVEATAASVALQSVDLSLRAGIEQWDGQTMHDPHDLMNGAIKELEYDV
ncbi:GGDEF domain protein [Lacticaseibacillus pantheris DSM 15945 = JCM 12539 = NBRC 106106]|uniref:GGDEF domain protein n=1 Tax=Lacticaseibacillus pantheris DSM 15945 = JCM 12539 = NBRC 106106 TaxID=1423783 RepID=A0A0R1TUE9_9LACO|nr:hypothetical protein [Lacticaseibacillus pantheris]KRL84911.1 GGDEF domain protein [Lacticaseibacillus pantheris DSM 15945 = JCM 12539 = NBRC 106106]